VRNVRKRSTIWPVFLCLLLLAAALLVQPIRAAAKHAADELSAWADEQLRKPGDPGYLSLHYRMRKLYFAVDPYPKNPVVFLGDSITFFGNWDDLFPDSPVENRGIGGDSTRGVLNRLDQVIAMRPAQIFLMIGTNDLCYGRPVPDIAVNYDRILRRFKTELPQTEVYVQSVLPFNDQIFPSRAYRTNANIRELNKEIRRLAKKYDYQYIDLTPAFTGPDGRLPAKYTTDGLHLNADAYLVWRDLIKKWVAVSPRHKIF